MQKISRRNFLRRSAAAGAAIGLVGHCAQAAEPLVKKIPHAEQLGWRVGFSAYSFRNVTLFEALDKVQAVGLHYIELFSWQRFSPNHPDARPTPQLSKALRSDLRKKASDSGVEMVACYVDFPAIKNLEGMFELAAELGLQAIVGEPPEKMLDEIEKLAAEYKVDFALHNHPAPSHYWNPEVGLAALKGRGERMGFCCDTGHWCRCGLDPVETLKKVAPQIKTFHLKDLESFGVTKAKDAIWGQGKGRIADILAEVKKLEIKRPYFGIEWERNPNEPLQTHAASIAFIEKVAQGLSCRPITKAKLPIRGILLH